MKVITSGQSLKIVPASCPADWMESLTTLKFFDLKNWKVGVAINRDGAIYGWNRFWGKVDLGHVMLSKRLC